MKVISINRKKGILSIVLSVAIFGILLKDFSYKARIVFSILCLICGFIDINNTSNKFSSVINIIWTTILVVTTAFLSQYIMDYNSLLDLGNVKVIITVFIIFSFFLLIYVILFRWKVSLVFTTFIFLFLVTANYYVYSFRGNELSPNDLFSGQTALNVVGQYNITPDITVVYGWIIWGLIVFSAFSIPGIKERKTLSKRIVLLLSGIICFYILFEACRNITVESFGIAGTLKNGYYLNFFLQLRDSYIEKPSGYNIDHVQNLEKEYIINKTNTPKVTPDIIVIMDESFADLSILGSDLNTNIQVTPFIDSLSKNTIKGYALSSVFGGKTPNSEFEFLTGNTMAFLPKGSIPYQQYLNENTYSIVSYLKSYGYKTIATHPFHSNGWKRDKVYNLLGFDEILFEEEYPNKDLIKGLISDKEMFEFIIRYYENKQPKEKLFIFGITMQNHGGYEIREDFSNTISLIGYEKEYPDVEQYLSLIHLTDSAVQELINYFKGIDNPVVIMFYGDHFPNLDEKFFEEIHGNTFLTLEEQMLEYKIPFFIWANYDIQDKNIECTSINYLSNYLFETCGIELPPYNKFLKKVEMKYNAINESSVYSAENNIFIPIETVLNEKNDILKDYSILQYNSLFDEKKKSNVFFPYIIN